MTDDKNEVPTEVLPAKIDEEVALTTAIEASEFGLIERLQQAEDALEIFGRRTELMGKARQIALRATNPLDWVLFRARDGQETALLADSGATNVAQTFGISIRNIRPQDEGRFDPVRIVHENGAIELRCWGDGHSNFFGRSLEGIEASIRSDEEFSGRKTDATGKFDFYGSQTSEADLRQALLTRLRTKATRILAGLTKVPVEELQTAWEGTGKSTEGCRKGHGFGSSQERSGAKKGASGGKSKGNGKPTPAEAQKVEEAANKLANEVLQRTGDKDVAQNVFQEITSGPNFKGFRSPSQIKEMWQIEKAEKALRAHEIWGDEVEEPKQQDLGV